MAAVPIDLAVRRSEIAGTREQLSPEEKARVRDLSVLRSRWLDKITFDVRLTDTEQRIASGAVNRYLNRDPKDPRFGMFWPAVSTLAMVLGKGERTVWRALQRGRALGYFEIVEAGGGSKSAVYRLKMPPAALSAAPYEATLPPAARDPAASGTRPCRQRHPTLREDLEGEEEALASARAARPRGREAQRHQDWNKGIIPSDWQPTEADCSFAIEFGYDRAWVAEAVEWFRDYHLSRGTVLASTSAAWRGFVRHAEDFGPWGTGAAGLDATVTVENEDAPGGAPVKLARADARMTPLVADAEWRAMLTEFAASNRLSGTWLAMFPGRGLPPQNVATRVPMHIRKEFGFAY